MSVPPGNPSTELTPQNLQNLSFDKEFGVMAIEMMGYDQANNRLVRIAANSDGSIIAGSPDDNVFITVGFSDADYICDGTADNVQIQQAIDEAFAAGGGQVLVKEGTFSLDSYITLKTGVNFRGISRSGTTLFWNTDISGNLIRITAASNLHVSDFTLDGNSAVSGASGSPTNDNVNNGIYISGASSNVTIERVTIYDTHGNGLYTEDTSLTESIVVRDCEVDTAGMRGMYFQCDNVRVVACRFHDSVVHDGVQFEACNNVLVHGCYSYSNNVKGFECQVMATHVQFVDCQAYDNGDAGFEVANGCGYVDVIDCHAYRNATGAVIYQQEAGNPCYESRISGNTFVGNGLTSGSSGITISGCYKITLDGNSVSESGRHGILLQDGGILTVTSCTDCEVSNNTCYNNGNLSATGDGIAVFGSASSNVIENNRCFDSQSPKTQRYGVNVAASTVTNTVVRFNLLEENLTARLNDLGTGTVRDYQVSDDPGSGNWLASFTNTATSGSVLGLRVKIGSDTDAGNNDQIVTFEGNTKRWLRIDGNGRVTSEGTFSIGHTANPQAQLHFAGNQSFAAWGVGGVVIRSAAATFTDTTSSGTVAAAAGIGLGIPTFAASSSTTYTEAYTLYVAGPPSDGTNVTTTTRYGMYLASGNFKVATGGIVVGNTTAASNTVRVGSGGRFDSNGSFTMGGTTTTSNTATVAVTNTSSFTGTASGTQSLMSWTGTFAPTSGTADFAQLNVITTINQTGGASGLSRSLYINPTITAAADFRALEIAVNSQKAIYQSGASATNYLNGNTGIKTASPNSSLHVDGSFATNVVTKTTTYSIAADDNVVLCDTTSAGFTVTLPTAVGIDGRQYVVKDWKGTAPLNNITVATTSSQTIDGTTTKVIAVAYSSLTVVSDGANWAII